MRILDLPVEIIWTIFVFVWQSTSHLQDRCTDTIHIRLTCKHFDSCIQRLSLLGLPMDPKTLIPKFVRFKTPNLYIMNVLAGVITNKFLPTTNIPLLFWNYTNFDTVTGSYSLPVGYKRFFLLEKTYDVYKHLLLTRAKFMWDKSKKPKIHKRCLRRKAVYFKLGFAIDKRLHIRIKASDDAHYINEWHPELIRYFTRDYPDLTVFNGRMAYAPGKHK